MDPQTIQTIQLVLIGAIALAMLFQSIVLILLFVAVRKAATAANEQIESIRSAVLPLVSAAKPFIETSTAMLTRMRPRIEAATDDWSAITHSLRVQTADVQSVANDITTRLRGQAARLDALMTSLFDTVDRAGNFMTSAVNKPIRQVSAVLASAKAVVETLRTGRPVPRSQPVSSRGDNDRFV